MSYIFLESRLFSGQLLFKIFIFGKDILCIFIFGTDVLCIVIFGIDILYIYMHFFELYFALLKLLCFIKIRIIYWTYRLGLDQYCATNAHSLQKVL